MLPVWFAAAAWAGEGDCPDVPSLVEQARAAYDDAEVDHAKELVAQGYDALSCQPEAVPTEVLLDLYRADALVSLSLEDKKGAVYATIRAVVAEPDARPPDDLGPQAAELWDTWKERLSETTAKVVVKGAGDVWIDGHATTAKSGATVLQGEHLFQWQGADAWHSEVRDVGGDQTIDTGVTDERVAGDEHPKDHAPKDHPPREPSASHKHRVPVLVGGAVLAAAGAGAVGLGAMQEQAFYSTAYNAPKYGGCTVGEDCYASARNDLIRADAAKVNLIYGAGYGLAALGVAAVGLELFVLPSPTADGANLLVRVAW